MVGSEKKKCWPRFYFGMKWWSHYQHHHHHHLHLTAVIHHHHHDVNKDYHHHFSHHHHHHPSHYQTVQLATNKQVFWKSRIHFSMQPLSDLRESFISSSLWRSAMLKSSMASRHLSTWPWTCVRRSVSRSLSRMVKWLASLAQDFSLTCRRLAVTSLHSSVTCGMYRNKGKRMQPGWC